jgi:hypothetical protein
MQTPLVNGTVFLYLFIFCPVMTLIWLALWLNRRRIIRRICQRHLDKGCRNLADQALTRARDQRLINHQDELLLRDELGLQDLQ